MKKAISSILALVILLMIALVASLGVFVWLYSMQEDMGHHSQTL